MSEICRFYGIVIRMYYDDHPPPHFHVQYGEFKARIDIERLSVISGGLPARALGLVIEWPALHQAELMERWQAAEDHEQLLRIAPLA